MNIEQRARDLRSTIAELCDMMETMDADEAPTWSMIEREVQLGCLVRENATEILTALRIAERVMDEDWLDVAMFRGRPCDAARAIIAQLHKEFD